MKRQTITFETEIYKKVKEYRINAAKRGIFLSFSKACNMILEKGLIVAGEEGDIKAESQNKA